MKGLKCDLAERALVKAHWALDMWHPEDSSHTQINSYTLASLSSGLEISPWDFGSLGKSIALKMQPHEASLSSPACRSQADRVLLPPTPQGNALSPSAGSAAFHHGPSHLGAPFIPAGSKLVGHRDARNPLFSSNHVKKKWNRSFQALGETSAPCSPEMLVFKCLQPKPLPPNYSECSIFTPVTCTSDFLFFFSWSANPLK